ncbi:GNAT family N-acetyltransferase [Clostridium sp.]|uniref:GNAT family N-acetyltransferase n=1 Tax=Clostridium sp. TaxID=1506 RepID=UPI003D6CE8E0
MEEEIKTVFGKIKIDTKRLLIRRIENKDKLYLFEIMSDKEIAYDDGFIPYQDMNAKYEADFKYLLLDEMHYAIELKEYHKVIGIMHLTKKTERAVMCYEIGYDVNSAYRRKGYATEAVKSIIDYCFNIINIELLTACVYYWNIKSSNMLKKLGFIQEEKIHEAQTHAQFKPVDILSFYKER